MRIISGKLGGRRIQPPTKMPHTRPTTDMAKEGLFNILNNKINFEDLICLDLFGGTGSITYELASRGAFNVTVVEKDSAMYEFIKKNIALFNIDNCKLTKQEVFSFLETCTYTYDFIFAGPPYALGSIDLLPEIIFKKKLLNPNGMFVLEHTPRNNYEAFKGFQFQRNYGTTVFSFFLNDEK